MRVRFWYRPAVLLVTTFAALILVGTVILALPFCHGAETVGLLDAFFVATSAVCVTGLSTVDGGAASFSRVGQVVIGILMQLGGLGVMTFGAIAAQIFRRHVSFSSQAALQSAFFQTETRGNIQSAVSRIVIMVLLFELIGAVVLFLGMGAGQAPRAGIFEAAFLSVSAFCNAGFSVYTDSVQRFNGAPLVLLVIMTLIVLGGLGHTTLFELFDRAKARLRGRPLAAVRLSLNTRVVLWASAGLILGGAGLLLLIGLRAAGDGPGGPAGHALHALFQSITARTAGFNTIPIDGLPIGGMLLLGGLMFIGGSPGSCAGGVKTTSFAVWLARLRSRLIGRDDVNLFDRHVPHEVVRRAALIIAVAALWNLVGILILSITEQHDNTAAPFEHIVFEQISAFGTVGLSAGLTTGLSPLGKLWIIASMFVGRLGPLTVAFAVFQRPRVRHAFPTERVMIG